MIPAMPELSCKALYQGLKPFTGKYLFKKRFVSVANTNYAIESAATCLHHSTLVLCSKNTVKKAFFFQKPRPKCC